MWYAHKIAHIKWQEHVPNTTVLKTSVELRHFCRLHSSDGVDMSFVWITQEFPSRYSMGNFIMASGVRMGSTRDTRTVWRAQWLSVASHPLETLETLAMDRAGWRSTCKSAVEEFEVQRIQELEAKRDLRKSGPPSTSNWVPDLPPDVSLTDWASCPQQVTLVMMRPVVLTA